MQKIAPHLPLLADLHKLPAALCCCCWTLYNCPKDLSPFDVYVKQSSQILSTILSACTHQRIDVHVNAVSNFKYMHISRWKFSFYFSETLLSLNCISLFFLFYCCCKIAFSLDNRAKCSCDKFHLKTLLWMWHKPKRIKLFCNRWFQFTSLCVFLLLDNKRNIHWNQSPPFFKAPW